MNFVKRKKRTRLQQQKVHALSVLLMKCAIVLVVTTVVVYFMPRSNGFNYMYELGRPWQYGTMISQQKFNIRMSDSTMSEKQDSIARAFMPYFLCNQSLERRVKDDVRFLDCDEGTKTYLVALLDSVFQRGVMMGSDLDSLKAIGTEAIRVIKGNQASFVQLDRIMSVHEAYQFIVLMNEESHRIEDLAHMNINTILTGNLQYERQKSETELQAEFDALASSLGFVMVNEKIVDRGDIVTPEIYQKLKSYEEVIRRQQTTTSISSPLLWGQIGIVALVLILLLTYLSVFRAEYFDNPRKMVLLFALITLFCIIPSFLVSRHLFHVMVVPCCMVPIIIRVFLDSRTAFTFHIGMVLMIAPVLSNPFAFIMFQTLAGYVVVLSLRELNQRSQLIRTAILVTLSYCVSYIALEFATGAHIADLDVRIFRYLGANGLGLLFAYPVLWILEKAFGFISDVTLVELSNINHPLLQKMSAEAPGTFQHSLQVSNLAFEVAKKIGAKPQLVRTGALYHDIGKLERPVFFTENQAGGNPHKHLTPLKSAEVIIAHVTNGLALAEKHNLPEQIKSFIRSHHGLGTAKYFYITYKNEHPDEEVDESLFRYPGPNPATAEEAILMMADSVEAASRSLGEYTEESISGLVDKIVDGQMKEGFFAECPITFRDIAMAKDVLKERLRTMYHTRILYPELNKTN